MENPNQVEISDLVAVEVVMKCDGSKKYAAGVGWDGASADMRHCGSPIHHRDLSDWRKMPITELKSMFPSKYDSVVDALLTPGGTQTFYLGEPEVRQ